jgi:periplasmic protein TonB
MNHARSNLPYFFSCNAQCAGIFTSAIIHAAVMLLLYLIPVTEMTPHLQTIQMSLEYQDAVSSDSTRGTKRIDASKDNQAQNKISAKTFFKSATAQKAVSREITSAEQQEAINPALHAESRNLEVSGSIKGENQVTAKANVSITPNTESQGITETQFGEMGAPAFIHRKMPFYPILARRLGKEGKVILKLLIDRNGRLQNVEVVEHAEFGFTEAAVAAVKKSTYAPASRNGENVTTRAILPVRFRLQ